MKLKGEKMKKIKLMNKIAAVGLAVFPKDEYIGGDDVENPDAIMVRSASLHEMTINPELLAIARCGAGVNNIPLDKCAENGVVVFNTAYCLQRCCRRNRMGKNSRYRRNRKSGGKRQECIRR